MFYTKFIFQNGSSAPRRAPSTAPSSSLTTRQRRSADYVKRQKALKEKQKGFANRDKENRKNLLKQWKENNKDGKIETPEVDPKLKVFAEIKSTRMAKEVYLMMSLIERFYQDKGGSKFAEYLYQRCRREGQQQGKEIDLKHFYYVFSSDYGATERLGFYYVRPIDKKNHGWAKKKDVGWHVNDKDGKDENMEGKWLVDVLDKRKTDKKGVFTIQAEMGNKRGGGRDTGLGIEEEEKVIKFLNDNFISATNLGKLKDNKKSPSLHKWVITQIKQTWKSLGKAQLKPMILLYGKEMANYMFRYEPSQNRLYFMKIQGRILSEDAPKAGYIKISKSKEFGELKKLDKVDDLKIEIIAKMKPKEVQQELLKENVNKGETLSNADKLKLTDGLSEKFTKGNKVQWNKLDENYLKKLKVHLKKELKIQNLEAKSDELAQLRIVDIKAKIKAAVDNDSLLSDYLKEKEDTKIEISIYAADVVKVKFARFSDKAKAKTAAKAKEVKDDSPEAAAKGVMARLEEKVKKKFGKGAPFIMYFLTKVLKIGDGLKKMAAGESSMMTSMVLGFLGLSVGVGVLRGKKFNQKKFDKLVKGIDKEKVFKKYLVFNKKVKLKGVKIVIPKGGIKTKTEFDAKINGKTVKIKPIKVKMKDKIKKGPKGYAFTDKEITIPDGTVIPADTVLFKNAKIIKV